MTVAHDVEFRYRVLLVEAVELLHRLVKVQDSFLRLQKFRKQGVPTLPEYGNIRRTDKQLQRHVLCFIM